MAEEINEQQAEAMLRDFVNQKSNKHTFLSKVVETDDTTRVGNLSVEELGNPQLELRGIKELSLISRDVCNISDWADYFDKLSEITTSTSLSKEAMLLKLAGTDKQEMADMTPTKKENKGWFTKK